MLLRTLRLVQGGSRMDARHVFCRLNATLQGPSRQQHSWQLHRRSHHAVASRCRSFPSNTADPSEGLDTPQDGDSTTSAAPAAPSSSSPSPLPGGQQVAAASSLEVASVEGAVRGSTVGDDSTAVVESGAPLPSGASGPAAEQTGSILQQKGVQEMLLFAVPALGLVLCDPLMSLIDTACLGQVSSVQLAALGPNTAIFNFVFQLFAFLGVATTSTIASNAPNVPSLHPDERVARVRGAQATLSNSLCLALACGLLATAALLTQGGNFLRVMGTPAEVVAPAMQYLWIRALAAPAVMITNVSQGACLGQQDAWTPCTVVVAAALLSAVGDIYLVMWRGLGVVGAAAATTAAQYIGAIYFLWHLRRKGKQKNGIPLKFLGLPQWGAVRPFLGVASALFGRTIFGMAAYFVMTASATRLGTLSTAAHQVAMQVFWFLSYIPEPLSLAAQSLIARDRYAPQQASQWAWLLLKAGALLGVVLSIMLTGVFMRGTFIFTSDVAVQSAIASLTPIAVVATLICSVMMMCDGICIGASDYYHLPLANAVGLGLTVSMLWASQRMGLGLAGVWWSLVLFYVARLGAHVWHFAVKGQDSVFGGGGRSEGKLVPSAA